MVTTIIFSIPGTASLIIGIYVSGTIGKALALTTGILAILAAGARYDPTSTTI
jgi:hypothetical protein